MVNLRKAKVFYKDEVAGYLEETENGYLFRYDQEFLKKSIAISATLPPRNEPYQSKELFPFFKGILPEGWYLDIVSKTQKVDKNDSFGILLSSSGGDTIGAVTVKRVD